MKPTEIDYTKLTALAARCGLIPMKTPGMYSYEGLPVDLSACAEDEKSILRTALKQMAAFINAQF